MGPPMGTEVPSRSVAPDRRLHRDSSDGNDTLKVLSGLRWVTVLVPFPQFQQRQHGCPVAQRGSDFSDSLKERHSFLKLPCLLIEVSEVKQRGRQIRVLAD